MQIQVFKNKSFGKIRVIGDCENPLFCASDVCKALGYSSGRQTIQNLFRDGVYKLDTIDSLGRKQTNTFLSEPQLYKLILRSNAKNAESFQDWVCGKVLPSIRKQGYYIHSQPKSIDIPESIPYREELANLIKAISEDDGIYFDRLKAFSIQQNFDEIKNEREITLKLSILKINETQITTTRRIR